MQVLFPRPHEAFLLLCVACAGPGAPVALDRGVEPMTNDDALVLYCAGLDRLLADARDAGLRRALGMLDDRLLMLPAELGEDDFPLPVGRLVFDLLAQPMSLTVDVPAGADRSRRPRFDAQLTVGGSEAEVADLARRVGGLLAQVAGAESREVAGRPGLHAFDTPLGTASHGIVATEEAASLVLALGDVEDGPLGLGSLDLPAGVEPLLAFKLDMGRLQGALDTLLAMAGVDGHGLIPPDAISASIVQSDPSAVLVWLGMASQDPEMDLIEVIHTFTGVHLEQDMFDHLGTTMGYYTADSTGGGGLMSLVLFVEVVDEAGLAGTLEYVLDTLARIEGDDLVTIGRGDPSIAANLVSFCGGPLVKLIGLGLVAFVPAALLAGSLETSSAPFERKEFEMEELSPEEEAEILRALREQAKEGDD